MRCVGERIKCNFLHNWLSGFDLSSEIFIGLKAFQKSISFTQTIIIVVNLLYIHFLYSKILNIKSKVCIFCLLVYIFIKI